MQVVVYVDGRLVMRGAHQNRGTGYFHAFRDRPGRLRSVEFSKLVLTGAPLSFSCAGPTDNVFSDDESVASASCLSDGRLQKLGSIEVEMRKAASFREGTDFFSLGEVSEIGPVHEKSKKAGSHAVS